LVGWFIHIHVLLVSPRCSTDGGILLVVISTKTVIIWAIT
jgi:hypothetical protein